MILLFGYPFYAARHSRDELDLILALAGLAAGLANGSFAVVLTDLFHAHPVLGCRTLIQHRIHRVQRNVSARRDHADSRDGRPTAPAVLAAGTALITLIGSSWLGRHGGQYSGAPPPPKTRSPPDCTGDQLSTSVRNEVHRHLSVTKSIDASLRVDSCI